jgi:dephospho-CoA kinase
MSSLERDLREYEDRKRQIEAEVTRSERELKLAEATAENEDAIAVLKKEHEYQLERLRTSISDVEDIRQAMQRGR